MNKILILAICIPFAIMFSQTPVSEVSSNFITVTVDGNSLNVPYYRNLDLSTSHETVDRAVVVQHGTNRNASTYYNSILEAAQIAGEDDETTILIAPQFLREIDIDTHNLGEDLPFWSNNGWKIGHKSRNTIENPRQARISSFAVMDSILFRLCVLNENLKTIVLAGHSAGGQFVNRFLAGSVIEPFLKTEFGVSIRYVVANPSSYLYFQTDRVVPGTLDQFAVPSNSAALACPTYNEYKYGLDDLNSYMSSVGTGQIVEQYEKREVYYLLGELDNDPNSNSLDISCSAMMQGEHRLERGIVYYNYLNYFFGPQFQDIQHKIIIPNVGHSNRGIFTSACGVFILFEYGNCQELALIEDMTAETAILLSNYPNPFNPNTIIVYSLPKESVVTITVYDMLGKEINQLISHKQFAGNHSIQWSGTDHNGAPVSAGIYFYQLKSGEFFQTEKMVLLR